ncbi:hypothetical protein F5X97DRAFT_307934 [Nemania serpens]|nr:hypothetical protein F5X97DRAFT_307934 [Nemania serpens]
MCLKIVTQKRACDVRPIMRHPFNPTSHIVDPFTAPRDTCCADVASKPSESRQYPTNQCCQVIVRSFSCDSGNIVIYHRYISSKTPSAYTVNTAKSQVAAFGASCEVSMISRAPPLKPSRLYLKSYKLRVRLRYAAAKLRPMEKELEAASRKKDLKDQNLRNGVPYEKQVQAAHDELEHMASVAWDMQTACYLHTPRCAWQLNPNT